MKYIQFLLNVDLRENEIIKEVKVSNDKYRRKYFISNYGDKVYSLCKDKIKPLSIDKGTDNYYYTTFQNKNKREKHRIHKLVADTFLDNPYKGQDDIIVHHKDKNIFNNNADNLIFLTRQEHAKLHSKKQTI